MSSYHINNVGTDYSDSGLFSVIFLHIKFPQTTVENKLRWCIFKDFFLFNILYFFLTYLFSTILTINHLRLLKNTNWKIAKPNESNWHILDSIAKITISSQKLFFFLHLHQPRKFYLTASKLSWEWRRELACRLQSAFPSTSFTVARKVWSQRWRNWINRRHQLNKCRFENYPHTSNSVYVCIHKGTS